MLSLFSSSIFLLARGLAVLASQFLVQMEEEKERERESERAWGEHCQVSIWQLLLFRAGHGFFAGTAAWQIFLSAVLAEWYLA